MYDELYSYDFSDSEIHADKEEILFDNVYIDIDTRKLTSDQEYELLEKLEEISWRANGDEYTCYANYGGEIWAEVSFDEMFEDDDSELYGRLFFEGFVAETIYDEVLDLLVCGGYDVTFKEV